MARFEESQPTREANWRSIILRGDNTTTYKFALARSLLELAGSGATYVPLDDLAEPFARHTAAHLRLADRQGTGQDGPFLEACRAFNAGELPQDELLTITVARGFTYVLDAFHKVNRQKVATPFFEDERLTGRRGITLTSNLFSLGVSEQSDSLPLEVEARWRLVETAWSLRMPTELLDVHHDDETGLLSVGTADGRARRRAGVTSARDALNGYQAGRCFYCYAPISIDAGADDLADVDHFFPHTLSRGDLLVPGEGRLDEVWNLVLACWRCNRGPAGKFARVPAIRYLYRLHARNEHLIASHHPLRETLRRQTGRSERARERFLQDQDRRAIDRLLHRWEAVAEGIPTF